MNRSDDGRRGSVASKRKLVFALAAAGALSACGATTRYGTTALELSGAASPAPADRLASAWKPLDRGYSYALSDEERVRARFFLDSCVSELTARFEPPPSRAIRAAQISDCMRARGWHLVVEEVAEFSPLR
jgi:hypothetical protein